MSTEETAVDSQSSWSRILWQASRRDTPVPEHLPGVTEKQRWGTPLALYNALDDEFGFELDAAAEAATAKHPNWLGPDHPDPARRDALSLDWTELVSLGAAVFCNPPYSPFGIRKWVEKFRDEALHGGLTVVVLVYARVSSVWWHKYVMPSAAEVRLFKGRLAFDHPDGRSGVGAPAGSSIIVFKPGFWTPRFSSVERPGEE